MSIPIRKAASLSDNDLKRRSSGQNHILRMGNLAAAATTDIADRATRAAATDHQNLRRARIIVRNDKHMLADFIKRMNTFRVSRVVLLIFSAKSLGNVCDRTRRRNHLLSNQNCAAPSAMPAFGKSRLLARRRNRGIDDLKMSVGGSIPDHDNSVAAIPADRRAVALFPSSAATAIDTCLCRARVAAPGIARSVARTTATGRRVGMPTLLAAAPRSVRNGLTRD